MTGLKRVQFILLAAVVGFAALFVSLGLLGATSPVLAQEPRLTGRTDMAPMAQPPPAEPDFWFGVVFTDPAVIEITDYSGITRQGVHEGKVSCNGDNCSQKTHLDYTIPLTDPYELEYRFKSRQAIDPVNRRVVVSGIGTIGSGGEKAKFSFTATIQDYGDGTVSVNYVASRPDASFTIERTRATFRISSRR